MRSRLVALPVALTFAASFAVAVMPTAAQAAGAQCTYTPVLPKRVVVNKAPDAFRVPVKIGGTVGGSACAKSFSAQEPLTHKSDSYTLAWQYNNRTSTDSIAPITVKPGTYRAPGGTNCVADTSADMTCKVEPGSTVFKFGGRAHLSADRLGGKDKDKVQFTVRATRYATDNTYKYLTTTVSIQRKDAGKWHTIHSETAHGKRGYVWTHSDPQHETYRAVSAGTKIAFGATSGTVTK